MPLIMKLALAGEEKVHVETGKLFNLNDKVNSYCHRISKELLFGGSFP